MIRYYAIFDESANRFCSDLVPCENDILACVLAKRFTFNAYCRWRNAGHLILCRIGIWDSEESVLNSAFTSCPEVICRLSEVDTVYSEMVARNGIVEDKITVPDVSVKSEGEFMRDIERNSQEVSLNE